MKTTKMRAAFEAWFEQQPWHWRDRVVRSHVFEGWQAALSQPASEGWKLVPVEPTPEMLQAAFEVTRSEWSDPVAHFNSHYRAMLAAAPTPPQGQPEAVEPVGETYVEHGSGTTKVRWVAPVPAGTKLYTAHYSPTATRALRMAADAIDGLRQPLRADESWVEQKAYSEGLSRAKSAVLAVIPPTESDQRKLGFAEGVKAAAAHLKQIWKPMHDWDRYAAEELLKLTPPTDTVTMTRETFDKLNLALWGAGYNSGRTGEDSASISAIVAQHMPEVGK